MLFCSFPCKEFKKMLAEKDWNYKRILHCGILTLDRAGVWTLMCGRCEMIYRDAYVRYDQSRVSLSLQFEENQSVIKRVASHRATHREPKSGLRLSTTWPRSRKCAKWDPEDNTAWDGQEKMLCVNMEVRLRLPPSVCLSVSPQKIWHISREIKTYIIFYQNM